VSYSCGKCRSSGWGISPRLGTALILFENRLRSFDVALTDPNLGLYSLIKDLSNECLDPRTKQHIPHQVGLAVTHCCIDWNRIAWSHMEIMVGGIMRGKASQRGPVPVKPLSLDPKNLGFR
jgi:hypothetical protein